VRIIVSGFVFNPPTPLEQYQKDGGPRPTAAVLQRLNKHRSRSKSPGRTDTLKRQYSTSAVRRMESRPNAQVRPSGTTTSELRRQYSTLRTGSPGPLAIRGRGPTETLHPDAIGAPQESYANEQPDYPVPIFSSATFHKAGEDEAQIFRNRHKARLARRAYLRHSFNRIDFIAVVSYWIALALELTGVMSKYHVYIFRMLSCLRIFRLLSITEGTSVIPLFVGNNE
jgi:Ion transport protein